MSQEVVKRFVVKVFLYEIEPLIWRRFSIAEDSTMAQLHIAIQEAMGWENQQQHEFRFGKGKNLNDVIAPKDVLEELPPGVSAQDEEGITIKEFLGRGKIPKRFMYRYDFTDSWVHEIVLEAREEGSVGKPIFLEGERACPPEDCGGSWGYNSIMSGDVEALDDDWDAEHFDPAEVKFS